MAEAGEQGKHFGFYTLPYSDSILCQYDQLECPPCSTPSRAEFRAEHQTTASQQTLDVTLSKLPCTSEKAKRITESIALFICKDIRPYSVVENAGFRNMIHTLEPRYVIPSRKLFADTVVPKIYDEVASE
ncbi:zinc finger BED domain-containing protein 1-like, partial [Tachysurus ichikawai]